MAHTADDKQWMDQMRDMLKQSQKQQQPSRDVEPDSKTDLETQKALEYVNEFGRSFVEWQKRPEIYDSPVYPLIRANLQTVTDILYAIKMGVSTERPAGASGLQLAEYMGWRQSIMHQLLSNQDEEE